MDTEALRNIARRDGEDRMLEIYQEANARAHATMVQAITDIPQAVNNTGGQFQHNQAEFEVKCNY